MEEARQIKVEKSEATTAEEEEEAEEVMKDKITEAEKAAKGKGFMDDIKEVTNCSITLQPKSNRPASDSNSRPRQRPGLKKKVVIKVQLDRTNVALKLAAAIPGVERAHVVGKDRNLLEVIGDQSDVVHLATLLRKKDIMEDEPLIFKEEEDDPMLQPPVSSSVHPHVLLPINESVLLDNVGSAKLNGGMEMEMDTKANTRGNHGLGNAELSSCTSKRTEWALLITSLLLEAISAIFEQLGYALAGMVIAFLALLLSIIDLIHKARKEGIKGDGRSLLPSFSRHLSHDSTNRKPIGGLVEYFGLAGAVWQCSYSAIQYYYTRRNLNNPIKICLLPFIFALCVAISKLVKNSPHEIG